METGVPSEELHWIANAQVVSAAAKLLDVRPDSVRASRLLTGKFNRSYELQTPAGVFVIRVAPPADSVFLFYERDMMR